MNLAIIIPAYKIDFFELSLQSLEAQTNKNFTVYIGDDNSPSNLYSIVEKYERLINIKYHKFSTNLGGKDLVGQWNRCVELTGNEEWIWLFSDDDIAESNCVQTFYHNLGNTNSEYDVYRFNTIVIDKYNVVSSISPISPYYESSEDLALNILSGKRGNSMPDHIYRKSKYIELKGFVNFAFGQASDWATSMIFSYPRGIISMPEANVKWRYSTINISAIAHKRKKEMIFGFFDFLIWINTIYLNLNIDSYKKKEIKNASLYNLKNVINSHYRGIPFSAYYTLLKLLITFYSFTYTSALKFCISVGFKSYLNNFFDSQKT